MSERVERALKCSPVSFRTRWGKKVRPHLMAIILPNLNRFAIFFSGRFPGTFAVNGLFKIPLILAYVATLPCERLMLENKQLTINYKVV